MPSQYKVNTHGGAHVRVDRVVKTGVVWKNNLNHTVNTPSTANEPEGEKVLDLITSFMQRARASTCTRPTHLDMKPANNTVHLVRPVQDLIQSPECEQVSPSYLRAFFSDVETVRDAFQYSETPCVLIVPADTELMKALNTTPELAKWLDLVHVLFVADINQRLEVREVADLCDVPWMARQGSWAETIVSTQRVFPESWAVCVHLFSAEVNKTADKVMDKKAELLESLRAAGSLVERWAKGRVQRNFKRDFSVNNNAYGKEKKLIFTSGGFLGVPSQLIKESPEVLDHLASLTEFAWLEDRPEEGASWYADRLREEQRAKQKMEHGRLASSLSLSELDESLDNPENGIDDA